MGSRVITQDLMRGPRGYCGIPRLPTTSRAGSSGICGPFGSVGALWAGGLWSSGDIRGRSPGFLCGYGFWGGLLGCCCLLLGTLPTSDSPIYSVCHADLTIHVYLSIVLTRVIISFRCFSDANPGLRLVISCRFS